MVATLAKMAVPTYYIESQAAHEGHEGENPGDPEAEGGYYTGGGKERPGEWYNPAGLFRLKDGGLVRDKTFYALAGGFSPDGVSLVRNAGSERRSPGFDLTFSADKSISALWALSTADEREALERAVIDAARRALADTIFRHCATTRVGAGGRRVEPGAMLAATFLHRTSRDGDPQLHVHATIFNLVKTHADGEFRALHGYPLYSWKMAAGAAFRSHLAYLMRRHLGIEMERHGPEGQYTRVAAMDPELEQAWSQRRREIVETVSGSLGEEALTNPAQMAAATLATRRRKGEGATTGEDIARFRKEAAALVDLEALRQRVRETPVADVTEEVIDRVREEVAAIPAKLARMDAVFRQPDMVEKVENALGGLVASDAAERWHAFSLAGADLVPLAYREPNPDAQAGMAHKRLFTTRETLEAEQRLKRLSQMFVADQTSLVPAETVEAKLQALRAEGKTFSPEQARAIHHATSHRLALIEGAAGSGKSHILHPLAQLWRGEGKTVRALAVAWRTAVDLGTDMQAPPAAVHPFLRAVAKGTKTVDEHTVLVVDEAGMLSVRQALQLVQLARTTGCQLVLVGDTQQQQPVEAGPGLRLLRDAVGSVRIDHIRRQLPDLEDWLREVDSLSADEAAAQATGRAARAAARARFREMNRARAGEKPITIRRPWQRGVSALLRNGAMDMAFTEFHRRGRMGLVDGKEEALHDLVARWAAYTAEHPTHSTIVMARTRADVRALSVLLRERHHAMGDRRHKDDRSAIIRVHRIGERGRAREAPLEVRPGERLRIGATVYDLGLYNGTIVTVTGIEPRRGGRCRLTVRTADRRTVRFAPEEIRNWLGE
ncbi:MAG: relaxase domain-containing protein, partial [Alphaproteobacteria bacterium]|nr:relaxase domain-containing protein [Alphaproteobacteria bacterium]